MFGQKPSRNPPSCSSRKRHASLNPDTCQQSPPPIRIEKLAPSSIRRHQVELMHQYHPPIQTNNYLHYLQQSLLSQEYSIPSQRRQIGPLTQESQHPNLLFAPPIRVGIQVRISQTLRIPLHALSTHLSHLRILESNIRLRRQTIYRYEYIKGNIHA